MSVTSLGVTVEVAFAGVVGQGTLTLTCGAPEPPTPGGIVLDGPVCSFDTDGFTFDSATVRFPVTDPDPEQRLFRFPDEGAVQDVTLELDGDVLVGEVSAFSVLAAGRYAGLERLAGAERTETAAVISAATFAPGVDVAFVATSGVFADALVGGVSAGLGQGPVLLAGEDGLPDATRGELARLRPGAIVVLGGEAALPASLDAELAGLTDGAVTRVAGANRFDTAALLAERTFPDGVDRVYLATGATFADALAGGPAAVRDEAAVLLVNPDSVPPETAAQLKRLAPEEVTVLGGELAVADGVLDGVEALTGVAPDRLFGVDRFDTARVVAETFDADTAAAFVATGLAFADALAATPAAGVAGAPVVLVPGDVLPDDVAATLAGFPLDRVVVTGGEAAVADAVRLDLRALLLR